MNKLIELPCAQMDWSRIEQLDRQHLRHMINPSVAPPSWAALRLIHKQHCKLMNAYTRGER